MSIQRLGTALVRHEDAVLYDMLDTRIPFIYPSSPKSNMGDITTRSSSVIRLGTWNVYGSVAHTHYHGDIGSSERLRDILERVLNAQLDFCGMQECYFSTFAPVSRLKMFPYTNAYFGIAEPHQSGKVSPSYDYGNSVLSAGRLISNTSTLYSSGLPSPSHTDRENRCYIRTVFEIRGIRCCVYTTHLSYEPDRVVAQMQELTQAVMEDDEERIVVMGDFNHDNMSLFNTLANAGFEIANRREFNTAVDGTWFIDNILYKGFRGLHFRGMQEQLNYVSDHKMFYVELEV